MDAARQNIDETQSYMHPNALLVTKYSRITHTKLTHENNQFTRPYITTVTQFYAPLYKHVYISLLHYTSGVESFVPPDTPRFTAPLSQPTPMSRHDT
jgi:hypothetical protein